MIHDDLIQWRQERASDNYAVYLAEVAKLPAEKREAALALWGIRTPDDIPFVLGVIHHVENGRRDLARAGMRDRNEPPVKYVSPEADGAAYQLLDGLRTGDFASARKGLELLEKLYVYASSCPSRDGFRNVLHVLRMLKTDQREPMPNLVAMGEDYDPTTRTATPNLSNEALKALAAKFPPPASWYEEGQEPPKPA